MANLFDRIAAALADRYPVERELGRGGMATVYLAQDRKHGRRVAIKVLRPELATTLGPERFIREITIAAQLAHPHILPLFDSGQADGFLYYVMPYLAGESLRDRLDREGSIPVTEAVRLTQQIASALAFAHEHGVIHRDIKPENILLTGDQAIVADFGIARAVEAARGDRLTETGLAVGTPAYMSPEQALGETTLGATTDVYSLGCVVFEMLTGRPPFQGPTPLAVLAQHAGNAVPSLGAGGPGLPVTVERVVNLALAKHPGERLQSATELAEALLHALTPEAAVAEARRVARRRWILGLSAAGMVMLLSLVGWSLMGRHGHPIRRIAVLPASNMTRDTTQDFFVDGVQEALVGELQRSGIAVIARQSVLQYRGTDKSIRQIAGELGVDGLIQPAVGREGDSVLVDITLYDGGSELALWTGSFPAHVAGVLGLYRTISARVAGAIGAALSEQTKARLAERPSVDPRVYDAVLHGRDRLRRFTPEDLKMGQEYFESALAIDSSYAPAYVGLELVWAYRAFAGLVAPLNALSSVHRYLHKALALDSSVANGRTLEAGMLVWGDWNLEAGAAAYRRALELDPNDAEGHVFYGQLLAILGRTDEALAQGRRAIELDPLSSFVRTAYGAVLMAVGRPSEAVRLFEKLKQQDPAFNSSVNSYQRPVGLGQALAQAGQDEASIRADQDAFAAVGDGEFAAVLERGWRNGGFRGANKAAVELLVARSDTMFVPAYWLAQAYARAGEAEEAIDWLEEAVQQHDMNIPYFGVAWDFRALRDHPRFRALARKIGLPLWKGTAVP